MKKLIITALALTLTTSLFAQKKVREKDIVDTEWQLVIDVDREDIEEEIEEEEGWLTRAFARSVANFALDVVESIDIELEFRDNGDVRFDIEVMGQKEVEYGRWYISKDGELVIEGDEDDEHIKIDDIDVFMLKGGDLVGYEKGSRGRLYEKEKVYLKRK